MDALGHVCARADYEESCETNTNLPDILCIITGKGPLRSYYEGKVAESKFKHVRVSTMWLKIEDYPLLLGQLLTQHPALLIPCAVDAAV